MWQNTNRRTRYNRNQSDTCGCFTAIRDTLLNYPNIGEHYMHTNAHTQVHESVLAPTNTCGYLHVSACVIAGAQTLKHETYHRMIPCVIVISLTLYELYCILWRHSCEANVTPTHCMTLYFALKKKHNNIPWQSKAGMLSMTIPKVITIMMTS